MKGRPVTGINAPGFKRRVVCQNENIYYSLQISTVNEHYLEYLQIKQAQRLINPFDLPIRHYVKD